MLGMTGSAQKLPPSVRAVVFCLLMTGCGTKNPEAPSRDLPPKTQVARASWVFHPTSKEPSTARLKTQDGDLEVDRGGSRWLHRPSSAPVPASLAAPEPLVALFRADDRFGAVGEGGTVYLFEQPLGPWQEVRHPPRSFSHTRRVGDSLFAVDLRGALQRSLDWGKSWHLVSDDEFFVSVDEGEPGLAVVLSVPERWQQIEEKGSRLVPLVTPPMAPLRLGRDEQGLYVDGLLSLYRWKRGAFLPMEGSAPVEERQATGYSLPEFAGASEIQAGHAVLEKEEFLALRSSDKGGTWSLSQAALDRPLKSQAVEGLPGCRRYLFNAQGDALAVLCEAKNSSGTAAQLSLFRGSKKTGVFQKSKVVLRGDARNWKMAISGEAGEGSLAISGACPLFAAEKGCKPDGLVWISSDEAAHTLTLPVELQSSSLRFDDEGRLWALGRRSKDGHVVLVGPIRPAAAPPQLVDLTRDAEFLSSAPVQAERKNELELLSAEGGLLTVIGPDRRGTRVATVRASGQIFGLGEAPLGTALLHGAGQKLLAVTTPGDAYFESPDGGLSWKRQNLPRRVCDFSQSECRLNLICSQAGCLLGDELSRIGWGTFDSPASFEGPPALAEDPSGELRPPLLCRTEEEDFLPLPGLSEVPEAHHAALGDSAWVQVQHLKQRAQAISVRAEWGAARTSTFELLPAVGDPSAYHLALVSQVEGNVAVRFPVSGSSRIHGSQSLRREKLEIGWDNRISGVEARASLPFDSAAPQLASPFGRALYERPELVSVADKGLYFRRGSGEPTYFLTPADKPGSEGRAPALVLPESSASWLSGSERAGSLSSERVRVSDEHAGLFMIEGGRLVIHTDLSEGGASATPYLMGPVGEGSANVIASVSLAYSGTRVGFVTILSAPPAGSPFDRARAALGEARAWFVELGPGATFLPPVAVPMQTNLPEVIQPCSRDTRAGTPRVVAPRLGAAARQVSIEGLGATVITLQTDQAVLFGTPKEPCVAAFDAASLRPGTPSEPRYHALIFFGEGQPSWLFRVVTEPTGDAQVSVRPLKCP